MKKSQNFEDGRIKRPERLLYIPPALRFKSGKKCEDRMKHAKGKYTNEATRTLEKHDSLERYSKICSREERFDSSSSSPDPKHTTGESYKDDNSSDFENYCDLSIEDLNINKERNESSSDDHWETRGRGSAENCHGAEIGNHHIHDKIPKRILAQHKSSSDDYSYATQPLANVAKLEGRLFDYYDDSISDIEPVIDSNIKKRSVLTSTPYSDITDQKVLNAANYVPEKDNELNSTLLSQTDIHESINKTNKNEVDNNFDIYSDPPSIENQPIDYTELFGNNYIPPPVPPPAATFRLPPIQRMPSISTQYELFEPRHASLRNMPPFPIQLRRPRLSVVPSIPKYSDAPRLSPSAYSSYFPSARQRILSPCFPPVTIPPPNAPHLFSSLPRTVLCQERIYTPLVFENVIYPPDLNLQNLEMYKQESSFNAPLPVSHPQLFDRSQQISTINLHQNVQSYPPSLYSLTNRMNGI